MTHEMFPPFLSQNWSPHADWNRQMKSFQDAVKDWNKNTFGNIFAQKHKLLRRLHGISRSFGRGPNDFLEQLQKELWEEYEEILVREELLWFQKSRCKSLASRDKNSKYFHGITKIRRRKNFFETL